MPSIEPHVIRRQLWQFDVFGSEQEGFALQRRMPELCRALAPALEPVLDRAVAPGEHWTIDRIEIDAGTFGLDDLDERLIGAVIAALEKRLRDHHGAIAPGRGRRTGAQAVQEALVHFLETGSLPWWFQVAAGMTLEEVVQASWRADGETRPSPRFASELLVVLRAAVARTRLVQQFSDDFVAALLASLSGEAASAVSAIVTTLPPGRTPGRDRVAQLLRQIAFAQLAADAPVTPQALMITLLAELAQAEPLEPGLQAWIARHWPQALRAQQSGAAAERGARTDTPDSIPGKLKPAANVKAREQKTAERARAIGLEEGVFVGCAGVVLLHPFLPQLFGALGIAAEDKMLRPERALALTHFLATGERTAPEYELVLAKLLCGVPLEQPVPPVVVTADEEEEANALLGAVIRHWGALGDTSIEGLRGTFLGRPGKLSQREDGNLLQVEGRAFDVLLDRLPWGIGTIRLPWMKSILWVEWTA